MGDKFEEWIFWASIARNDKGNEGRYKWKADCIRGKKGVSTSFGEKNGRIMGGSSQG